MDENKQNSDPAENAAPKDHENSSDREETRSRKSNRANHHRPRYRRYYDASDDMIERIKREREKFDQKIREMGDPSNYNVTYIYPEPRPGSEIVPDENPLPDEERDDRE